MKQYSILATLFVVVFLIAAGSIVTNEALTIPKCARNQCLCISGWGYCSHYTGDLCTDPANPYYHYSERCFTKPDENCGGCQTYAAFDGCCADPD